MAVAVLLSAGSAQAEVRTATFRFAAPETPPSLEPRLPETQTSRYSEWITVSYDTAGSLTIQAHQYDSAFWGDQGFPYTEFSIDSTCRAPSPSGGALISGHFEYSKEENYDGTWTVYGSHYQRKGYEGSVVGAASWDGQSFTWTFTHWGLADLDLRCVALDDGNGEAWFAGYEPKPQPTPPPKKPSTPKFTPHGFDWCGWKDLADGGWTFDRPDPGFFLRVFGKRMTCKVARRNQRKVKWKHAGGDSYRPTLGGYRCRILEKGDEYYDIQCTKRGRPGVAFRYQTGA